MGGGRGNLFESFCPGSKLARSFSPAIRWPEQMLLTTPFAGKIPFQTALQITETGDGPVRKSFPLAKLLYPIARRPSRAGSHSSRCLTRHRTATDHGRGDCVVEVCKGVGRGNGGRGHGGEGSFAWNRMVGEDGKSSEQASGPTDRGPKRLSAQTLRVGNTRQRLLLVVSAT